MIFNAPLSSERADRLVQLLLETGPARDLLDVGCGAGELLIRLHRAAVERSATSWPRSRGLDIQEAVIAEARSRAEVAGVPDGLEFAVEDVKSQPPAPESLDIACCISASHAFLADNSGEGGADRAIETLSAALRPGGRLLLGEGYWRQPPEPAYLELIGGPPGIDRDHAGNLRRGVEAGLVALDATVASVEEWDRFEWAHQRRAEEAHARAPEDAATRERVELRRRWMAGYLEFGRATMGFGFYLFRKPGGAMSGSG